MGSDRDSRGSGTKFKLDINVMGSLEGRIVAGEYIDSAELASLLRQHGSSPIPDSVLDYVCKHLEGTIAKPKGRRPMSEFESRRSKMIVAGLYHLYLDYLTHRKSRYGVPAGWTRSDYTPAELAARIVAKKVLYGEESWRSVQNIASSHKSSQK